MGSTLPIASFMVRKEKEKCMRYLFKYMGNIIMYEEMLGYVHVHRAIFIVTFLYYILLSRLKKLHNQPLFMTLQSSKKYLEL